MLFLIGFDFRPKVDQIHLKMLLPIFRWEHLCILNTLNPLVVTISPADLTNLGSTVCRITANNTFDPAHLGKEDLQLRSDI